MAGGNKSRPWPSPAPDASKVRGRNARVARGRVWLPAAAVRPFLAARHLVEPGKHLRGCTGGRALKSCGEGTQAESAGVAHEEVLELDV